MIMDHIAYSRDRPIFYSFEIFQDDVRPPLGFGSTGSRSIQYANPENYITIRYDRGD